VTQLIHSTGSYSISEALKQTTEYLQFSGTLPVEPGIFLIMA
jgi:hypothetical protein